MKIGVVGAGAMGSLFGARLTEAGVADVVLVDVNQAHIDAIREHGLIFEDGGFTRRVPIRATTSPQEAGRVDFIIFFCKYPDSRRAIVDAAAMLSRAAAGLIGERAVFLLPGSPKAVALAMEKLILPEAGHLLAQARRPSVP